MISNAYTYYMSQYGNKVNAKYDTHTKNQLKSSYGKVLKSNSLTPTYKVDISEAAQKYAIDLKEHARELGYIVRDLSDEKSGEMTYKKTACSDNPEAIAVKYIGDGQASDVPGIEMSVKQLAGSQVNTGNYLQPDSKLLQSGTHTFELSINNLTYEFEFNVSEEETTGDVQGKIARLINRSDIGLKSSIVTDQLGNTAIRMESDATGVAGIKPTIFNISSNEGDMVETLGFDRVTEYPSNAVYTVDGKEYNSMSNDIHINNIYEVKLLNVTRETSVKVGMSADEDAVVESISDLIGGYNKLFLVTKDDANKRFAGNDRLQREFARIAMAHRATLGHSGLTIEDDGSVAVNREEIAKVAGSGKLGEVFAQLNDFKKDIQRKAESIATNPMNYVNNKIVAYKNPNKTITDPYNTSMYSGMMFDGLV